MLSPISICINIGKDLLEHGSINQQENKEDNKQEKLKQQDYSQDH